MPAPPFTLTEEHVTLLAEIERLLGRAEGLDAPSPQPLLRKRNRVRTIHASVAIEGNRLSPGQVTAVLEGRRVVAARKELLEVTNAHAAYEQLDTFAPGRVSDLLRAHGLLMTGLLPDAGRLRTRDVGVLRGTRVAHVAPPWRQVPRLVRELLAWVRTSRAPPLVKACVAHYELLFIHPFTDGNGRIARLWQQAIMRASSPLLRHVAVESVIRERQKTYYAVLRAANSTAFVTFSLVALRDGLSALLDELRPQRSTAATRLGAAQSAFARRWFTRADYLKLNKTIASATASRDLLDASQRRLLERRGERRLTEYRFRT